MLFCGPPPTYPAADPGADTDEVLVSAGLSPGEIAELREAGAIS
jgi:crotonobetainyl-CoA:carnitine CoA-transferase CaiB-like acyl-CoA transferase